MLRSPLVHFLLLGALLLGLQQARALYSTSSEASFVEVRRSEIQERILAYQKQMGRPASQHEAESIERQLADDALWLQQAFALGLHKFDPVVRQRLILNMKFLEGTAETPNDELVRQAIELGMDRSDTVVQRRLVDRVQAMIRASVQAQIPDETRLRDYHAERAERWREPAYLDLTHVYFSRDKRAASAHADAQRLLKRLIADVIEPSQAIGLADAFLSGHEMRGATPTRIVARLGARFAEGVEAAATGRWIGPVESAFGLHLVWIHQRIESRVPNFEEVRPRVLADWIDEETRAALRLQLERRRQVVDVRVIEDAAG